MSKTSAENICIITDLDGTFLPHSKEIAERDLQAVRRFTQAGGIFTIATGRTVQACRRYAAAIALQYPMIVCNGAGIYDPVAEKMLSVHALPDQAKQLTAEVLLERQDVGIEVLCPDTTWVVNNTPCEQEHVKICGITPFYCTIPEVQDVWMKVLFSMPPEKMPGFMEWIASRTQDAVYQDIHFIRSEQKFYEMLPAGISKGSSLAFFRALLPGYRIIAVGDYDNDITMLQAADMAVCPANAADSVKAVCDRILTRTCNTCAMEELIEELL